MTADNPLAPQDNHSHPFSSEWLTLIEHTYALTESNTDNLHNNTAALLSRSGKLLGATTIRLTDSPNHLVQGYLGAKQALSQPLVAHSGSLYLIALTKPFVHFNDRQRQYFALFSRALFHAMSLVHLCDELTIQNSQMQDTLSSDIQIDLLKSKPRSNLSSKEHKVGCQLLNETLVQRYSLTKSEVRLALLIAEGLAIKQISARVNRSENTLRSQLKVIYRKTQRHSQFSLSRLVARKRQQLHLAHLVVRVASQLRATPSLSLNTALGDSHPAHQNRIALPINSHISHHAIYDN